MANFWENDKVVESPTENFWEKDAVVDKKTSAAPTQAVADPNQGDFMRAVSNYLPGLQETYGGAKVLAGNVLGSKELVQSGVESMKTGAAKQVAKESDEFTNAWDKGIGTVLTDWLPYQVGSGVMSMAEIMASMGVGAGVGAVTGAGVGAIPGALTGALGKTLLKKGVKEIAEGILEKQGKEAAENYIQNQAKSALVGMGKTAGIAGNSILHGTGEVTNRAVDELETQGKTANDLNLARVLPAAAVHSVADFVADKITLGAVKGLEESAKKGLIYEVTKQISLTGAKETLPEEVQTIAERYGANLSLSDAEALKDYVNTAAAAVGMSVIPGGIGGVRTHLASKLSDKTETDKENNDKTRESTNTETAIEDIEQPDPKVATVLAPKFDENGDLIAAGGTQNVVQQTDAGTSGDSTEVSGGPTANEPAATTTRAGRPGVVSDQSTESTSQNGEGSQQPTLSFKDWLMEKGNIYNSKEEYEAALPGLQEQYQAEMSGTKPAAVAATKRAKSTATPPATPAAQSYLDKPSFYGAKAPTELAAENKTEPVEVGISHAGHETAFDAYDTVDIKNGVMPELKALAEERNKVQQVKRQQMRQELTGKIDEETGKKYTPKRITSLVSGIPIYQAGAPLEFLTEDQLVDIYNKHADKREFVKEERTTRTNEQQSRQEFLAGLDPLQQAKVQAIAQRSFADEVVANARRKAQTTEADKRKNREKKQSEQLFFDSEKLAQDIKDDAAKREAEAQKLAEKETAEEKDLETTAKEVSQAAEKVLPKRETKKEKPVPTKSKLVAKVENAIKENDTDAALDVIANEKINERGTRTIAQSFLKLIKDFGGVTIQFNELPAGEDGMFDPATNTIALNGKDGVYVGERPIDETVMHEVGHYLIDHVVDNREAYLKSIKDPAKRKEVEKALNRLDNNFRFVKGKLGDKFNIPTMKEFLAELFGNTSFQVAIANIDEYKTSERVEGFNGPVKKYKAFEGGVLATIVRNIANALGFSNNLEGVTLKEILEDVFKIVSLPTAELRGKEVSYAKKPDLRKSTFDNPSSDYDVEEALAPKNLRWFKERFFTTAGWRKIAYEFQNDRHYIKHWENTLEIANKIKYGVQKGFNNIYTQLTLATSLASNYYKTYVAATVDRLDSSIMEYAKAAGISTNEAMKKLHVLIEALHEPERRFVKYLMNVPLKDPAADRRKEILDLVRANNKISKSEAQKLANELKAIVGNKNNIDTASKKATDIGNSEYNVLGIDTADAAESRKQYEASPYKGELDNILANIKELNDATSELNKIANYWSQPVTNIVNFYGWDYYAPFKGNKYTRHGVADELLDFDSTMNGKELQEMAYAFDGSMNVAENPVLQVLADASRAAARAGRKDLTQSIFNAITPDASGKKLLEGRVAHNIKFEDRDKAAAILKNDKNIKKENTVFHYREDGSIDIIEIHDKKLRESIRRTYQDSNPMVDIANTITSRLGQLHTRYNYNFAPMNFIRDALTNAWTIGADMGPVESAKFIKAITGSVAKGGLFKAMEVAHLLQKNDMKAIKKLANTPGYEDMVDYILHGGMVSYLQSLTTKSNFDQINKRLGKNKIAKTKEQLDSIVDTWTDMFEITSRAAAFGIAKRAALASNLNNNMSPAEALSAANEKAASYSKNLANFEQVGQYGKAMGAFYMFFRPSATGAVRAIEAVAPAFPGSLERAITSLPSHIQQPDPKDADSVKALEDFKKNYAQKQQNARIMVMALMGMGTLAYTMSAMMAPDDDLGRNKLMTDNMDQWTRFWRIHIPGFETPIQIPWGFGLGSFAAAGAQLASVASGQQKAGDALANVFLQVSLDSFVPIPVSRMKPADNPLAFAIDSIAPSTVRPVIEFLINKNGLGQDIYNSASGRRLGDAFLGGDKIPEMYKNAAAALWDATDGAINISPNTMYFLSNSYADGPARVFEGAFGITDTITGRKEFSAKTDLPLIGSFFGAESNIDSREWVSVKKQIEQKVEDVKSAKLEPERYARYTSHRPFDEMIVELYNKDTAKLNKLGETMNKIRLEKGLSPKEKQEILKVYTLEQNIIKRSLIEQYKAYGVEP